MADSDDDFIHLFARDGPAAAGPGVAEALVADEPSAALATGPPRLVMPRKALRTPFHHAYLAQKMVAAKLKKRLDMLACETWSPIVLQLQQPSNRAAMRDTDLNAEYLLHLVTRREWVPSPEA